MKHAFAEKRAAERDAIETADKLLTFIDLDGVAVPTLEQCTIDATDAHIDPCAGASRLGFSAAIDHAIKIAIDVDRPRCRAYSSRQPQWDVETVERNDAAHIRLDPIERRIIRAFGHREDPAGIGLQQHVRRDLDEGVFAVCHGSSRGGGYVILRQRRLREERNPRPAPLLTL